MQVLAICGSLRARSSNRAALEAAKLLAPPTMAVELFEGLAALPLLGRNLDAAGIAADPELAVPLREALGALRRFVAIDPA